MQDIVDILQAVDLERHYPVYVCLTSLANFSPGAVDVLLASARIVLSILNDSLREAQEQLRIQLESEQQKAVYLKPNAHIRLIGSGLFHDASAEALCPQIGGICAAHIGKLLTVRGTVVKTGIVKALEARRLYECNKCKHRCVSVKRMPHALSDIS